MKIPKRIILKSKIIERGSVLNLNKNIEERPKE